MKNFKRSEMNFFQCEAQSVVNCTNYTSIKSHFLFCLYTGDQNKISEKDLEAQFHALRRLVASKAGFRAFTTLPG